MPPRSQAELRRYRQAGGITIMVSLMLLVFLTLIAAGMSRNSFREVAISGTARQGAMVRNTADSGVEWGILWLHDKNRGATGDDTTAKAFYALQDQLRQDDTLSGVPYNPTTMAVYDPAAPPTPPADLQFPKFKDTTQGYSVALTRMGKLPITDQSQGAGAGAFTPAQGGEIKLAPDLWAVRTDAQVKVGTGAFSTGFRHSKEAWISTPVR